MDVVYLTFAATSTVCKTEKSVSCQVQKEIQHHLYGNEFYIWTKEEQRNIKNSCNRRKILSFFTSHPLLNKTKRSSKHLRRTINHCAFNEQMQKLDTENDPSNFYSPLRKDKTKKNIFLVFWQIPCAKTAVQKPYLVPLLLLLVWPFKF